MGGRFVREGSRGGHGEEGRGGKVGSGSGCICTGNDSGEISSAGSWTGGLRCGNGAVGSGRVKSRKTGSVRQSGRWSGCHGGQTNHPGKESDLCFLTQEEQKDSKAKGGTF